MAITENPETQCCEAEGAQKLQLHFELARLRAEEFERNFYSLRGVEWQVAFQSYVGYGAIAAGFSSLKNPSITMAMLCIAGLLLLFSVSVFWQWQIQRRLRYTQGMKKCYLDALHLRINLAELTAPKHIVVPCFQKWWGFVPWLVTNIITVCVLVWYIKEATDWCR